MQSLAVPSISKRTKYIYIMHCFYISFSRFIVSKCCIVLNSSCIELIQLFDITKYTGNACIHLVGKHHALERY